MTLSLIVILAAVESVVYQGRYRATHGTPMSAALWTGAVCALRIAFIVLGVSAVVKDQWVAAIACYAVPAAVVTGMVRVWEIRLKDAR